MVTGRVKKWEEARDAEWWAAERERVTAEVVALARRGLVGVEEAEPATEWEDGIPTVDEVLRLPEAEGVFAVTRWGVDGKPGMGNAALAERLGWDVAAVADVERRIRQRVAGWRARQKWPPRVRG